jgi:tetratricopeptide (TPR) repeat protein
MALNTIGEIYLSKARYAEATEIFEKAAVRAKKSWRLDSPEWIKAQNGLALSAIASGDTVAATDHAQQALSAAESEWGSSKHSGP